MDELLERTALVDYDHPSIRDLVAGRGWVALDEEAKIRSVYDFVRDEIRFAFALVVKGVFIFLGSIGVANMWEAVIGDVGVSLLAVLNAMRTARHVED